MKTRHLLFFLCFMPFLTAAQELNEGVIDTSFTNYSASLKVKKDFPDAVLVNPVLPQNIILEKDIVYSSTKKRDLHLDLFHPADKNLLPAVVLIHGGGWKSGSKEQDHPMAIELSKNEYIAAAVEYSLSGEEECRFALLGSSAGGQLAALAGTSNLFKKFDNEEFRKHSSKVHAIVDIDGVLDMTDPAESGKDMDITKPSAGKLWFGYSFSENPDIWREASALNYVDQNTPPIIFINSSIDRFHAGRDEMVARMEGYGIYYEIHTIPDSPHTFWLFHPWFNTTMDYTIKFLNNIFKRH